LQVIDDDDIGLVSSSSGGDGEFFNLKWWAINSWNIWLWVEVIVVNMGI
jgi:hypothetical protein